MAQYLEGNYSSEDGLNYGRSDCDFLWRGVGIFCRNDFDIFVVVGAYSGALVDIITDD